MARERPLATSVGDSGGWSPRTHTYSGMNQTRERIGEEKIEGRRGKKSWIEMDEREINSFHSLRLQSTSAQPMSGWMAVTLNDSLIWLLHTTVCLINRFTTKPFVSHTVSLTPYRYMWTVQIIRSSISVQFFFLKCTYM